MKILIDPGHGGKDCGAVFDPTPGKPGDEVEEEDITLEVSLKLGHKLQEGGHSVIFTRDRDTTISPSGRLNMINQIQPEIFISIHCNASVNPEAHGCETIYRDEFDVRLAQCIQKSMVLNTGMRDRGVKQDVKDLGRRLAVLGNLQVPSALVEIGFISNPLERTIMTERKDLIVSALKSGIEEFIG